MRLIPGSFVNFYVSAQPSYAEQYDLAEVWLILYLTRCWIFGCRFLTIAGATISIETNTNSWLFSDIIEQDLTLVIRVVNLCLQILSDWWWAWYMTEERIKWSNHQQQFYIYSQFPKSLLKFLRQQFSKLETSSKHNFKDGRLSHSSCETKELKLKVYFKVSGDLTLATIFTTSFPGSSFYLEKVEREP